MSTALIFKPGERLERVKKAIMMKYDWIFSNIDHCARLIYI